jgi:hypothetical protein
MNKKYLKQIEREYRTLGTGTVSRLYEWVMLKPPTFERDGASIEAALREMGKQVEKERYDRDVLLAAVRRLTKENEELRQLDLFRKFL